MKKRKLVQEISRNYKRITCSVLAANMIFSAVALTGCGSKDVKEVSTEEVITKVSVEAATPATNNIEIDSDFIGTVEADKETSIIPKISGEVTAKNFEVGDYVNAGDLLFTIDDSAMQINKQQAEASIEQAAAGVNSAEAGLIAAQAQNAATKASVNETLGTMDTKEQQLQNSVNSAKRGIGAAQGNYDSANQAFATTQDATSKVGDKVDAADRSVSNTESYLESREGLLSIYNDILNASSQDAAFDKANSHGANIADSNKGVYSNEQCANAYISAVTSYTSGADLIAAVSSARTAYETAKSTKSGLEGSKSSALLAQIQSAIQTQITKDSILTAKEAEALTEKLLEDYENYTKATITASANAQIVGGDASVISSNNSLTTANAGLKSAQANLANVNLQLGYTKVITPVSGKITAINIEQYDMASPQAAAYVISTEGSKKVTFYVAEAAMTNMIEGQQASIEKEGIIYNATISKVESTVDSKNGLFKIEAMVVNATDRNFITGTSVKITTATQQAVDAMTVPIDAVYFESAQAYVYCIEDGVATRKDITTGISDDKNIVVLDGLNTSDRVITTWDSQLKEGAFVSEVATKETDTENVKKEDQTVTKAEKSEIETVENKDTEELVETLDQVNIRAEADTKSEKVGMAAAGEKYTRLEETADGWSKILFKGAEAYIKSDYVKVVQEETINE